jgi:hypothetical protein
MLKVVLVVAETFATISSLLAYASSQEDPKSITQITGVLPDII